jgi:hypothetical protein
MKCLGVLVSVGLLIQSGCAFRPDSDAEGLTGNSAALRMGWWVDEHTKSAALLRPLHLVQSERLLRSDSPVTLPAHVPDLLDIELSVPKALAEVNPGTVVLQWVKQGSVSVLHPVKVQAVPGSAEVTTVSIALSGVHDLLPNDAEASGELRFIVQKGSGEVAITAVQELRTAPVTLEITQGAPDSGDFEGLDEPRARAFVMSAVRYDLLQVVRVRNLSAYPIELEVPMSAPVSVKSRGERYITKPAGPCGFDGWVEFTNAVISEDVKVVALAGDIARTVMLQKGASEGERKSFVTIQPGAVGRIGTYFSGPKMQSLAEGTYKLAVAGKEKIVSHCESRCDHKRTGADEFPRCWTPNWRKIPNLQWRQIQDCLDCGNGSQRGCESCAVWEKQKADYLKLGPNCLFCGELVVAFYHDGEPIYRAEERWRTEQVWIEALFGVGEKVVAVEADVAGSQVVVRYADSPRASDPEGRSLPFLKSTSSIQIGH